MATTKVRALYSFNGEAGTAELSITPGEVLFLIRQDIGEGWWEGRNQNGQTGLFPAAYVEVIQDSLPPSMPPPQLPESYMTADWNEQNTTGEQATNQGFESNDYWDDEWDDDSEGGQPSGPPNSRSDALYELDIPKSGSTSDINSLGKADNKGTVGKKNFNRFTAFVKSGFESYILGSIKIPLQESDKITILETEFGVTWYPISNSYLCQVASPKKESKLKGLKSFIAYQLTPTFNNLQVSRRYKHFDWLHERLEEKFSLIPIPPLPDKQISGRYEEQFIEHRRIQLQKFVDYLCNHPVLSSCEVWLHFMTCTDEKRWKAGKRKAEKDELVGANYFMALQAPERSLDIPPVEQEIEIFSKFIHGMDSALKNLVNTVTDQTKKHQGPYKREYQKIGQAFTSLGNAFYMDGHIVSANVELTNAVKKTGDIYNEIGSLFEEQPKFDWEPLADTLHIYKGIISSFPDILAVHKSALQKRKECEKLTMDHKMEQSQFGDIVRRTDVVSYALLAEVNHFHTERERDFRQAMKDFLDGQIKFYQNVVSQLQNARASLEFQY